MLESNKKKKPTKKQAIENFEKEYQRLLRESFITNMIKGFTIASNMYLEKINSGCTMEELKEFINKNINNEELLKEKNY